MSKILTLFLCLLLLPVTLRGQALVSVDYGDRVLVDYEINDPDGKTWVSTKGSGPVSIAVLRKPLIPALVHPLLGMTVGERKQVTLTPQDAFGPRRKEAVVRLARETLVDPLVRPGASVTLRLPQGREVRGRALAVDATHVTIDTNHPLAGKLLVYRLRVLDIVKP